MDIKFVIMQDIANILLKRFSNLIKLKNYSTTHCTTYIYKAKAKAKMLIPLMSIRYSDDITILCDPTVYFALYTGEAVWTGNWEEQTVLEYANPDVVDRIIEEIRHKL